MIAEVVPVKRGKISLPFFDYEIPQNLADEIKIGQLVEIPLRSGNEFGIIRALLPATKLKKIKPIGRIIQQKPFLDQNCLKFLEEISEIYHVSLGSVIKSALPPLQKRKLSKLSDQPPKAAFPKKIFEKPKLFTYKNLDEKKQYLETALSAAGQTLILVPEAADIDDIVELLPDRKSIGIVTGYLTAKESFDSWMKIWQGETKIIIGTRSALFMSFYNLRSIIIVEDWHTSHKSWDSAPRIHARDAAIIAAKYYGSAVHIIGHTPTVENYFFAKHNVYDFKIDAILPRPLTLNLIDLRHESRIKNFSPLSHILQEALLQTATGSVFLYCNRRGSASYLMCRDCSNVLRCKTCRQTLTYSEGRGETRCHYCKVNEPMTANCLACGGINLMYFGKGTESIVSEIKKLFPNDNREIINIENSDESLKLLKPDKDQIIVGTQLAWPHVNWKRLALMAFVDADTPLFVPEFRSAEHLWDLLHDASFRLNNTSALCVQTVHPEYPVYANLPNPEMFYNSELEQRKIFGYPPYRFILKLFISSPTKESAAAESTNFFRQLSELTKDSPDIKITPPVELFPAFQKGQYWQAIIVKLAYSNYKQQLRRIMKIVPENWKVDPNPNSLLSS